MQKFSLFFLFLTILFFTYPVQALDPVAPKHERAWGFLRVRSPLPQSDQCEITPVSPKNAPLVCKSGEMIPVPVGQYVLKVRMQNKNWTHPISIHPTELTDITVVGYGNLKVTSPSPQDRVEVYSTSGQLLESFQASQIKTLPAGEYTVKVNIGPYQASLSDVRIMTNTTRELVASLH